MYLLRTSPASPFGRKVALAAAATGLADQLIIEPADVNDPNDSLLKQNPLGKIPALITPEGLTLFDSRVIIEFLDDKAGGGVVIPRGDFRWAVLRQQALADGLMDAALLVVYEERYRPAAERSPGWVARQQERMGRALDYAELHYTLPPAAKTLHVGEIALAAALGYLDLRFDGAWRQHYPKLVSWLNLFRQALPAFDATGGKKEA
ncbi:MAG: glutathione S-transferase family protein [Sodalis sp. (in: enterobacteria)]|uniref:glutathione S-transferase family protein n=1 Tax=Sodalis sp. (in: enterobacteria) TaxID=1898979 RepID=UPI0039E61AE5